MTPPRPVPTFRPLEKVVARLQAETLLYQPRYVDTVLDEAFNSLERERGTDANS